jgi:hypothetical protein
MSIFYFRKHTNKCQTSVENEDNVQSSKLQSSSRLIHEKITIMGERDDALSKYNEKEKMNVKMNSDLKKCKVELKELEKKEEAKNEIIKNLKNQLKVVRKELLILRENTFTKNVDTAVEVQTKMKILEAQYNEKLRILTEEHTTKSSKTFKEHGMDRARLLKEIEVLKNDSAAKELNQNDHNNSIMEITNALTKTLSDSLTITLTNSIEKKYHNENVLLKSQLQQQQQLLQEKEKKENESSFHENIHDSPSRYMDQTMRMNDISTDNLDATSSTNTASGRRSHDDSYYKKENHRLRRTIEINQSENSRLTRSLTWHKGKKNSLSVESKTILKTLFFFSPFF